MPRTARRLQTALSLVLALAGLVPGAAASAVCGAASRPAPSDAACCAARVPCPPAPSSGGCVAVRGCDCCLRTPAPAPVRTPLPASDLLGRPDCALALAPIAPPAAEAHADGRHLDRADRSARALRERLCVIRI